MPSIFIDVLPLSFFRPVFTPVGPPNSLSSLCYVLRGGSCGGKNTNKRIKDIQFYYFADSLVFGSVVGKIPLASRVQSLAERSCSFLSKVLWALDFKDCLCVSISSAIFSDDAELNRRAPYRPSLSCKHFLCKQKKIHK
jgi:hypothetical protein